MLYTWAYSPNAVANIGQNNHILTHAFIVSSKIAVK
jgi:hypothetical protein